MSTKAKTAKTVACKACAEKDATIKRQCDELRQLATKLAYLREAVEGVGVRVFDHSIVVPKHFVTGQQALADVARLTKERDALQSRIDGFIEHSKKIREACVAGGVTDAEKMATLTAVTELADKAKKSEAAWRAADAVLRTRPACSILVDFLRTRGVFCEQVEGGWRVRGLRRPDRWYVAIPRPRIDPCDRPVFFMAVVTALVSWGIVLSVLL